VSDPDHDIVKRANDLADDVLFPAALRTDAADIVPIENLDALADAGFYGLFPPPELGGLGADFPTMCATVEAIAGGCLTTALVWIQHFGLLGSLLEAPPPLRPWLAEACRGERRGGIAFGGLLPGPPVLTATSSPGGDGWILDGYAPWVSGWGRIDALHVAARGPDDTVVNVVIDPVEGAGVTATRQRLVAVDASCTVRLDFSGVAVPADRLLRIAPYDPAGSLGTSLRLNGSLALGVAARCCALRGPSPLDDELALRRLALDDAGADDMAIERANAAAFALQAAASLVVQEGSRSITRDHHAQRLVREATFLLVFGSRPQIRDALLSRL
jgi:alkylation response protein AidB-like acyl-CoA dehydrogenase